MIKYFWNDLWWLICLIAANISFYGIGSNYLHFSLLNLFALATMFVVGILNYKLHQNSEKSNK